MPAGSQTRKSIHAARSARAVAPVRVKAPIPRPGGCRTDRARAGAGSSRRRSRRSSENEVDKREQDSGDQAVQRKREARECASLGVDLKGTRRADAMRGKAERETARTPV